MKMKIKEIAIGLAFFAGVVELYASNLVYNSSFELEGAGWNSHTFSRVLDDKRAPFPENVSFPVGDAATGQRVLRIDCKPGLMETVVSSAVMPIKKNTWYTVSFSLKREEPGRTNFFSIFSAVNGSSVTMRADVCFRIPVLQMPRGKRQ